MREHQQLWMPWSTTHPLLCHQSLSLHNVQCWCCRVGPTEARIESSEWTMADGRLNTPNQVNWWQWLPDGQKRMESVPKVISYESTDLWSDGATGSGMAMGSGTTTGTPQAASRLKARSGMGLAMVQHQGRRWGWWRWWRSIEGGDEGTEGGGGVEGRKIGQPDSAKWNFTAIRVSRRHRTPLIPDTLLVSAGIVQSIPKMWFMASADIIQPIPIIFHIGWLTSADTNMLSL
jgi:hypothetical protein